MATVTGTLTGTATGVEQVTVGRPGVEFKEHLRFDEAFTPDDGATPGDGTIPGDTESRGDRQHVLAMFCYEEPDSVVGRFVEQSARALAKRQMPVHIFSRHAFELDTPGIHCHPVGVCQRNGLIQSVHEFTRRASNSFLRMFHDASDGITVMGHEWSAFPAVSLLHGIKNIRSTVSLHSMERQRGSVGSGAAEWIEETELAALREASSIIIHNPGTAEVVRDCVPECADRIVDACSEIPMAGFRFDVDPAEVKQRFSIGPVDPTILYIGDLDERYGPNLLMKAMPAILEEHGQARCIFVGDGELLWPLRVFSRYLLLDHAVRISGHLADHELYELIHSADVIVVPSIDATPWWPIEAAWAASRPVIATREAAPTLLEHEQNCLLVEPNEHDLAAGIDRVLSNPLLAQAIAREGHIKLDDRYSENKVIAQIEEAIGVQISV
ncbi:MAG: glycosyltransferase family 4 protein [Candidatus Nealsonbacteria bacterium]|nr:glycosyltransferase family 4 protein [Candidatus Nealsonbacteria bacterium]